MPLYEYECNKCKERFTVLKPAGKDDKDVRCPYCEGKNVSKIISCFSSHFGSSSGGWGGGCSSFG